MGRSQESFQKKNVRIKKEKKRQDKEKRRLARKENKKEGGGLDDMIAYVDETGRITSSPPDPAEKEKIKLEDIDISVPKQDPDHESNSLRQGVLASYNESKGYGFIKDSETNEHVFVHFSELSDDISEGKTVRFEIGKGPRGLHAVNVKAV